MKILYMHFGKQDNNIFTIRGLPVMGDVSTGMLFHGLRTTFGESVVDVPEISNYYQSTISNPIVENEYRSRLHGRGFTYHFLLGPCDVNRDNQEILKKISDRYFDVIFFGPCNNEHRLGTKTADDLFIKCLKTGNRVCLVDGDDLQNRLGDGWYGNSIHEVIHEDYLALLEAYNGVYFKRELVRNPTKTLRPLPFAFPKEKINSTFPEKNQLFARDTFNGRNSFSSEQEYYDEYRRSYFGRDKKKGGWDTIRHYEIIFNRCIPIFENLEMMPKNTMVTYPRELIKEGMNCLRANGSVNESQYYKIEQEIFDHAMKHMTTESLARYAVDIAMNQ